jgi:UDP-N-acetylglucosamine enolpyruvyl transferase
MFSAAATRGVRADPASTGESESAEVRGRRRATAEGRIRPAGNKNAALPMLAACLLTDEEVILENVPDIRDVRTLLDLIGRSGSGGRVARSQRRPGPGA